MRSPDPRPRRDRAWPRSTRGVSRTLLSPPPPGPLGRSLYPAGAVTERGDIGGDSEPRRRPLLARQLHGSLDQGDDAAAHPRAALLHLGLEHARPADLLALGRSRGVRNRGARPGRRRGGRPLDPVAGSSPISAAAGEGARPGPPGVRLAHRPGRGRSPREGDELGDRRRSRGGPGRAPRARAAGAISVGGIPVGDDLGRTARDGRRPVSRPTAAITASAIELRRRTRPRSGASCAAPALALRRRGPRPAADRRRSAGRGSPPPARASAPPPPPSRARDGRRRAARRRA